jgi:hypothetical protein
MKGLESILFGYCMLGCFIACILYVMFGQITCRKLRKNPATKDKLGVEFASGWDILNVAGALSIPRWIHNKYEKSPLAFLNANYQALYENTTLFDRILARVFSVMFYTTGISGMILVSLAALGAFD